MDYADIAQIEEERHRELALKRIAQTPRQSATDCANCGEPIPALRQATVPGVTTCVDCQKQLEKKWGQR